MTEQHETEKFWSRGDADMEASGQGWSKTERGNEVVHLVWAEGQEGRRGSSSAGAATRASPTAALVFECVRGIWARVQP